MKFTKSLLKDTDNPKLDHYTKIALEMYSNQCLIILEGQGKDQLPGGKYFAPDEHIIEISENVPPTNMCAERDFSQLNWLMRFKPHATIMHHSTNIQWRNNKTAHYLECLPENEREVILTQARKNAPLMQREYKEDQDRLNKDRYT